jgi:predicted  nucleic acid-binding Zn-ribbon protein
MDHAANIRTFEALKEFKAALQKYEEETRAALTSARSNMQRAVTRLQSDRLSHWKREQQIWTRKLAEAKVDLNRVQLEKRDMQASAVIERKRVAKAKQNLDDAERRIQRVRYWATVLERERMIAQGQCQQIERTLENEIPRLYARIERMLDELEQYVKLAAPETPADATSEAGSDQREGMAQRGRARPDDESPPTSSKTDKPPNNRQN